MSYTDTKKNFKLQKPIHLSLLSALKCSQHILTIKYWEFYGKQILIGGNFNEFQNILVNSLN